VAGRRAFVEFAAAGSRGGGGGGGGISTSRACALAKVSRRRLGYVSRKDDGELVEGLKELAAANPKYGCRMLCAAMKRHGRVVNLKRVRRLCREHGLVLKQKRKRKRRGIGVGVPCQAEHPGQVWAYDFVEDRTEGGRKNRA
jgi:putative transposase